MKSFAAVSGFRVEDLRRVARKLILVNLVVSWEFPFGGHMNEHFIRSPGLAMESAVQLRFRPSLVLEFMPALGEMTAGAYDLRIRSKLA